MLHPVEEIEVLGKKYDRKLTFRSHILECARKASCRITCLRRMSWLLDAKGRELLYKAQIRSLLEYSPLTWGGAAQTHLKILDRVQERAERIITEDEPHHATTLQSLQHRRDVSGLSTLYKIQQERIAHLQSLRQPTRQVQRTTRSVERIPEALAEPRCRTEHYKRTFIPRYVKKWNEFLVHHPHMEQ